ncbi:MAG: DUF1844 domain-containing protein [Planctomycetota bacterium]
MSDESEEPKIIIDEDYKTQVEREKAELREKSESAGDADSSDLNEDTPTASSEDSDVPPPPPASMSFLVTSLATQAMAALGQIPGEDGNPMPMNLDYAKHFIDLLGVLEEKTKGNLDESESKFLEDTLHQMRMMFVTLKQQAS